MSILETLLDSGSFVELNALMKNADVQCGYGTMDNRLVYVYNQTGFVSVAHAKKIAATYEAALQVGAPVIGILNSQGMKLSEGMNCLDAYGLIFKAKSKASGVIPQISVINGDCMGIASYIPSLSDFIFMVKPNSKFFLQSPSSFEKEENSQSENMSEQLVHFLCEDEGICAYKIRELLNYMPSNNLESACSQCSDDLNREDENLAQGDIAYVMSSISDNNRYMEVQEGYGGNSRVYFTKFNGCTTGVVFSNGLLVSEGMEKITWFITLCDAFHIPIVTLTSAQGYKATSREDKNIIAAGGRLINAFLNCSVGKVNILMKQAVGGSYLMLNSKHIGADVVFAWDNAEISLLEKEASQKVLGVVTGLSLTEVGELGFIDDIIKPSETRKRIIVALEMLYSKRACAPTKKHSS